MTTTFTSDQINEWKQLPLVKSMNPRRRIDWLLDQLLNSKTDSEKRLSLARLQDYCEN